MLAITTGLTKAASSTVYTLLISLLQQAGHDQTGWRGVTLARLAATDGVAVSRTGFMSTDYLKAVRPALAASGFDHWHAVKTNGGLVQKCRSLLDVELIKAIATFRDPGDAAASLLEHAERQVITGGPERARLAHIITLRDAIDHVAERTRAAATWLRDPRVLKLDYALVKDRPAEAATRLGEYLGLVVSDPGAAGGGPQPGSARCGLFAAVASPDEAAYAAEKFAEYAGVVRDLQR
ncbi:hypothetical protein V0U79_05790 [Hyphobacterium sp. HN65]|uniref:Sulfotransferase family protein n=1 Tax=Hyphobacterium lacteum TaxID=3116575 RepID=A0ABU7LQG0_9PROT|nr:hypothetical protein [Hyphobacterium sp. HN65]MEE2525871.1 hypothetical protein [Hyphobacterium sp. HN65]